jgi:transposase-like protein
MARRQYPDELKAVAMAALLSGQSINAVAEKYNIPKGTVAAWATRERNAMRGDNSMVNGDQRERIGELIIDNIEAMLVTTKEMLDVVKDKEWLTNQSASEVAVLYGVISDKTYRLLEALPEPSE